MITGDPSLPGYRAEGLELPRELSLDRVLERRRLLSAVDRAFGDGSAADDLGVHYRKAYSLIASPQARQAFDLSREPGDVRERYGLDLDNPRTREARQFGGLPHLGQCLLLTRRLIEAGVRVVTVCTGARYDQAWDTHRQHFPLLERSLLPMFDRGFSALLDDLHRRGLLDETLVVAMGEFGRTPRLGQITSGAGADRAGQRPLAALLHGALGGWRTTGGRDLWRQRRACRLPGPRSRHPRRYHGDDLSRSRSQPVHNAPRSARPASHAL